jgi:hypothetical protein
MNHKQNIAHHHMLSIPHSEASPQTDEIRLIIQLYSQSQPMPLANGWIFFSAGFTG